MNIVAAATWCVVVPDVVKREGRVQSCSGRTRGEPSVAAAVVVTARIPVCVRSLYALVKKIKFLLRSISEYIVI